MGASLVHEALFYRGPDGFVDGVTPFVCAGLDAGEPVLVSVPAFNGDRLRAALGPAAENVRILDMTLAGRNPGRIIPAVLHAFVDEHGGSPARIVGEPIWAGRSESEYPACVQHEAMINEVLAGADLRLLCPYDIDTLDAHVLTDAATTHPVVLTATTRWRSPAYTAPVDVVAAFNRPLREPAEQPPSLAFTAAMPLTEVRAFVREWAGAVGLAGDRLADLELAVTELVTNSLTHGGGEGTLRCWCDGDLVICEVHDRGHITDPAAGRVPPELSSETGRGLLLANYLSDLVQVHTTPAGTTIRVHMGIS